MIVAGFSLALVGLALGVGARPRVRARVMAAAQAWWSWRWVVNGGPAPGWDRARPPRRQRARAAISTAWQAVSAPPAPRVVRFVVVKRNRPRLGRSYGHWWVEVDGRESYGWWPDRCPVGLRAFLLGSRGTLNGLGGTCRGGTLLADPHHLDHADHAFHPTLVVRRTDRQVRAAIRAFAHGYRGGWRWSTKPTTNCRTFQLQLLDAAGLSEGDDFHHTRGDGCPILRPLRRALAAPHRTLRPMGTDGGSVQAA